MKATMKLKEEAVAETHILRTLYRMCKIGKTKLRGLTSAFFCWHEPAGRIVASSAVRPPGLSILIQAFASSIDVQKSDESARKQEKKQMRPNDFIPSVATHRRQRAASPRHSRDHDH